MAAMKSRCLLLLVVGGGFCVSGLDYRFDYEWDEEAEGWLKYHVIPATWDEARLRCHAEGAILASPLSAKLKNAIIKFVKKHTNEDSIPQIFTGVHSIFSKGDYASIEGTPLLRLSITWDGGEPDNFDNSERCLVMSWYKDGAMGDRACNRPFPYVCYKENTPLTITDCGTADTAYKLESNGKCYKMHTSALIWSQAYMTCVAEGGHLVIVDDDTELEIVKNLSRNDGATSVFTNATDQFAVGIHDWGQNGRNYMTIHGQDLETVHHRWTRQRPLVPQVQTTEQCSVNMFKKSGNLVDTIRGKPYAFLCEKDPKSLL